MSRPGILLDEMLSGAIAEQLRGRGFDAVAVVEDAALVSTPDDDLLVHAKENARALVTANIADFMKIANDWRASGRVHHGIVHVTYRAFPQNRSFIGAVVESLTALYAADAVPAPGGETFLRRTT